MKTYDINLAQLRAIENKARRLRAETLHAGILAAGNWTKSMLYGRVN